LAGAAIRPPTPFFSPSSRGRPSFGVGNPKNCSGYVGLVAGFPGTYSILVRDLPGLRDDPKNCSGYCTRALVTRQAVPGHFFLPGIFLLHSRCLGQQPEQLFALLPGLLLGIRDSGFGLRGFGIGVRDIFIYSLIYIHIIYNFFFFFRFFWQK